jgi:GSH-dependent disulfide-bond oxidoreductase
MIRFYYHPTPNPAKVSLFLEEAGMPYQVVPVDTSKGEQHSSTFTKINPNAKVPAIVDTEGPGGREARVMKGESDPLAAYPNIKKWFGTLEARPAVARAGAVGSDHAFKHERDEQALRALFPSNYPPAA